MKKILFILFFPFLSSAQSYEYGIITNVVQRGQLGNNTCWAASLEMLASAYKKPGEENDLQLKYIRKKTNTTEDCNNYANCPEIVSSKVGVLPIDSLLKILMAEHQSFNIFAPSSFLGNRKVLESLPKEQRINSLNWTDIKRNFRGGNPSPMLLWREFGNTYDNTYHITTAIGYFEVKIGNNNSSKFLLVNDPWVKKLDSVGTHYLVNYDQFMQTSDNQNSKIIMYGFKNRDITNLKIKLSRDTLSNLESFSYRKKFLQRKTIAGKKLAESNVLSLLTTDFLAENEIRFFLGSRITSDLKLGKSINVGRIKDKKYAGISEFRQELMSNEEKELYTLTTTENDTCFVYVTTNKKNAPKYTALSQRIEPYETSITKVLADIQEKLKDTTNSTEPVAKTSSRQSNNVTSGFTQNSMPSLKIAEVNNPRQYLNFEFDNVYMFKTYNSKPDFLLIPKQPSQPTSFILVDLFDKMKNEFLELKIKELPSIPGFEVPIKLPHFNYKLYMVDSNSLNTLLAIINQK